MGDPASPGGEGGRQHAALQSAVRVPRLTSDVLCGNSTTILAILFNFIITIRSIMGKGKKPA